MRRSVGWALVAVLLLAACGSDGDDTSSSTSSAPPSSTAAPTSTTTDCVTKLEAGGTVDDCQEPTSTSASSSTTLPAPSTTQACPVSGSTAAFTSPSSAPAPAPEQLRSVKVTGQKCSDRVVFAFKPRKGMPPQCTASYQPGPFSEDASDKPVTVAGSAFLVVRCYPARSYDPLTGETTYTAPPGGHLPTAGAQHIRDMAGTGDFEAVMSWVIGIDGQRPFHATATGAGTLVVNVF